MTENVAGERAKRESVFRTASIILDTGQRIECRVRNVSPTGVGVSHKGTLQTGMTIHVTVGKILAADSRVVWATQDQAGIAFDAVPSIDDPKHQGHVSTVHAGWLAAIDDAYRK